MRSSSLRRSHSGHANGGLDAIRITELNMKNELDVVSSEDGDKTCCEVSKTDGKSNGALPEREALRGGEVKGMEVESIENECRRSGSQGVKCSRDDGIERIDDCSRVLGQVTDVGGEGKESGMEGPSCVVGSCDHVLLSGSGALKGVHKDSRSMEGDKQTMIYEGEREELKENNLEIATEIDVKTVYPQVVVTSDTDDKLGVVDSPICTSVLVEPHDKKGGVEGSDCKFDENGQSGNLKTDVGQGEVKFVGRVLRSRVVPAGGIGADSGGGQKRKRGTNGRMEVSLVTAPVRKSRLGIQPHKIPEMIGNGVHSKKRIVSGEKTIVKISSKGEKTPFPENNISVKRKAVEIVGSTTAEKNSIRKRIVDMLLGAGWRVEYRPRQGKEYNDAVYVNPEGKTHWSVTKAYYTLIQEVKEGKVGFCFTPIPEEVLSKLFRVVSKTRSDKNTKKKYKKDSGDSSDEEYIRVELESTKRGKARAKRKPSIRDGIQSKRRCALRVRHSNQGLKSEGDGAIAYSGKHSVLAWMIDGGTIPLDGKVQYMNRGNTRSKFEGRITRDGIHCSCCKEVISVSEFEKHAGSKLCEPYEDVHLESGHSLLQCLMDSWNKQEETGRTGYYSVPVDGEDPSDDTCGICGDGGDLVCCDGCPSTFHHDCLTIEEVPSGEWHCAYCSCKFCGGVGETASERDDDCDTVGSSLVTCSLCDKKYHQSCIDEADTVCGKSTLPTFCGRDCEQIFDRLKSLVGAKQDFGDGFSWTLLQRSNVEADAVTLQSQKIPSNSKLAVALSVMDECFLPIIDPRSDINLIRHIVYNCGSNFNRLNFSKFFTVLLERGDEVISAASIRIHGKQLAEMPFIGTRNVYRRQGMCRRLLSAIELALGSLDVEKLVIPAISELMHTWTSVFGFNPLEESVKEEVRSMSMLAFPHTGMLQKLVSKQQFVKKTISITEDDVKCCESGNEHVDGGGDKSEVDNVSMNGEFDLNCVASDLPESSSDERHLFHPDPATGNCEDELKSTMNLMEENVLGNNGNPDFPEDEKSRMHHCSEPLAVS